MDYQVRNVRDLLPPFRTFDSAEIEKRGEQSLYEAVRHCMEHIPTVIRDIGSLKAEELDQLVEITQKIEDWSLAKVKFYDASWTGFLKRIFSCCRNAWSFGVFRSSGEQGLFIAAMLREEIRKRKEAEHLEPSEEVKAKIERILKNTERELFKAYRGFNMEDFSPEEEEFKAKFKLPKEASSAKKTTFARPTDPVKLQHRQVTKRFTEPTPKSTLEPKQTYDSPEKNQGIQAHPRGRKLSYTETPNPTMFVPESPSWQLKRNAQLAANKMPDEFENLIDEVLYKIERKIYETGKIFDLLDNLLNDGNLPNFIEKLGSGKLLQAYWACESSEIIASDTNRLNRIERLKVIFSSISEEQFKESIKQTNFYTIIGDKDRHYAKVAAEVLSPEQLERIASQCDSETRLTALSQILNDMSSLRDLIEARSENLDSESKKAIEKEVHEERISKIEAIIKGMGKLSYTVKQNKENQIAFKNIKTLIGHRAPLKAINTLAAKFKEEVGY